MIDATLKCGDVGNTLALFSTARIFESVFKLFFKKCWLVFVKLLELPGCGFFLCKSSSQNFPTIVTEQDVSAWLTFCCYIPELHLQLRRLQDPTLSQLKSSVWILRSKVRWTHFFLIIISVKVSEYCRYISTIKIGNSYSRLTGSHSTNE